MKKFVKMVLTIALCSFVLSSLFTLSACTCKHEWSDWTTLSVATCETEWVMTRSCNKCGTVENKKAPALGHAEVTDKAVEATCTATGLTEGKHCSRCNAVLVKQETVKALGHDFANYIYNNDATCLTDGTKTAKCSRCNATDTVKAENTAKGHVYGEWTTLVAATCETDGVLTRRCATCGNTEIKKADALGHVEVADEAVEATCTKTGKTEGKHCSRCNKVLVKQEEIKALGHDFANYIYNNDATCLTDGTKTAKCSRCNETDTVKAENTALGHAEVIDKAVAATCTTTGKTEGKHCSRCSAVLVKQEVVAAKRHNEVVDKAIAATCTTTGLTEGKHCSRCNAVLVKQETVKALGHAEVTDAPVAATCTTTGLTEGKHCSRCNEVLVKQETVKALGHKNKNGICLNCKQDISTKGLEYFDGTEENTLILAGMGTATDKDIIIPSVYNGKKVVSIREWCFNGKTNIASVDIPDSVTSIKYCAFYKCSSLKEVNYKGTQEQWNNIEIGKYNSCLTNAKRNYIK